RPDGKTQVTVRYVDGRPVEVAKVLISTQHREGAESLLKDDLWEHVIEPVLRERADLYDPRALHKALLINPTGRFVIGGPMGDCFGTEKISRATILELISEHFDLRPGAIRRDLRLHRPIYQKTAAYGHFGREDHDFTWERTDKAAALREASGFSVAPVEV